MGGKTFPACFAMTDEAVAQLNAIAAARRAKAELGLVCSKAGIMRELIRAAYEAECLSHDQPNG